MSAYMIVGFNPIDKEKLQQYGAEVLHTLKKFSGEYVAKGPSEAIYGAYPFQMQVILAFPSKDEALSWYQSEDYQAIIPLRDAAMDSQFQLIG